MNRTVVIIQARMGSTRLPGKVAMDISGRPMLERVVERARRIDRVDDVIIATSKLAIDDSIVSLSKAIGAPCFRGSEQDVLLRYYEAAVNYRAETIIRITADCPLISPQISCDVISRYLDELPDYAANTLKRTYPRGLDTEVLSSAVLEQAHREATETPDREHVTRFVWRQPERFRLLSVVGESDHSAVRLTVDTAEDLELVRNIYKEFDDSDFEVDDILDVLARNPEWLHLNAHVEQKSI